MLPAEAPPCVLCVVRVCAWDLRFGSVAGLPVVIVVDIVIESSVPVSLSPCVSVNRSPSSFSRSLVQGPRGPASFHTRERNNTTLFGEPDVKEGGKGVEDEGI